MSPDVPTFKHEIESSINLDPDGVKQLASRLSSLLKADEQALQDGREPSDLALHMPRKHGKINKINKLANEVAEVLFQPANDGEKIWSIIRYTQLISKLSAVVKARMKKQEEERIAAKRSSARLDDNAYCLMKSRPVSGLISNPTPMPVALTDISELQPFFSFLKSNVNPMQPHHVAAGVEQSQHAVDTSKNPKESGSLRSHVSTTGAGDGTTKVDTSRNSEESDSMQSYLSASDAGDGTTKVEFQRGIFYSDGRMDLCKQVVGPDCIEQLMASLRGNSHVKHFLLGNNLIGPVGAKAISDFLLQRPHISTWYLAGNCIDPEGTKLIAEALEHDGKVESLWLKRNPVGPVGALHLSRMLQYNTVLQTLDLSNCGLLDEGVEALVTGLKSNTTLQHLYLGANGITGVGAACIGDYFQYCTDNNIPGLVSLYLSVNRIGDEGVEHLAKGLRSNTHIKRLMLPSNQIQVAGVKVLCDALTSHPTLETLGLGMYTSTTDLGELPNRILDEGAEYLANLIRTIPHLALLDVSNNCLTVKGWSALATAALESPGFLHLDSEKFVVKADELRQTFTAHLEANIKKRYGMPRNEFLDKQLKYLRHPDSVRYIVSLYRTRDFRSRQARKGMKKLWDADDVHTLHLVSQHA